MNKKLLSVIVCPLCKGPLHFVRKQKIFICEKDQLMFPVRNSFPVLLPGDSRKL